MEKRNCKSFSEEISIILFEHGKTLCQVKNKRNVELSFEHGKGRSQAENGRNIELSFSNAVLRIASLFGRNIEESLVMRFPKSQIFFQEISRKDLEALLGLPLYDLCQALPRKGYLCDVTPLAGCPKRKSLCIARSIGQPERRKPTVVQARFLNFCFARQKR